jgi:hypothetical protein
VVADELVLGSVALEPAREALVQLGPPLLRQCFVGSVPDQQMTEAERVVVRERRARRPDELLADEPDELRAQLRP